MRILRTSGGTWSGSQKLKTIAFVLAALFCLAIPRVTWADPADVGTAWRLLDYISVDYRGAVGGGRVISATEYAEQQEFAATVQAKLAGLPATPERAGLLADGKRLREAIAARADPPIVAGIARHLGVALLAAYPIPLAPASPPSLARGQTLFAENCASCHGLSGDGRGPAAAGLATPPIAFSDGTRARERSIFALYQVITQGLDGTPMPSFGGLSSQDRWALAFYAGHFAYADVARGEQLWKSDPALHRLIPDLKTLVSLTPEALEARIGAAKANAVMAYLRQNPNAVVRQQASLSAVREAMAASLAASKAGDRKRAGDLALSAYLEGFEPVEPILGARDHTLMSRIESLMLAYRAAVQQESPEQLARRQAVLNSLYDDADAVLSPKASSSVSTFLGAAAILLREGLEAMLIVVAMIAFLRKAERTEVLPYVHAGWTGALAAGLLTWVVATWVIGISGASRELTEGFGSIFAALVLLSVGIWMHGKAQADQWQRYIREKMSKALSVRSAWFLFALAFIVVYREVFETILFYVALAAQGNTAAMTAGALTACVVLAVIAWAMLRYSRTLPIAKFFNYSAWLMAALTVVLAGKGVASLQEAGIINIAPLAVVPRVELIGLFPTAETVAVQVIIVGMLGLGFWWNHRRSEAR